MKQLLLTTILCIISISSLQAQATGEISQANNSSITDMEFIIQSYESGLGIAMFANLAKTQGSAISVQDFGKILETQHSILNNELQMLADNNNIALPTQLPINILNQHEAMKILQDSEFDKAYIEKMIVDYQNIVLLFENKINNVQNEDIQSWAKKNISILNQHLKDLTQLNSTLE